MATPGPFEKNDLMRLKWQFALAFFSIALALIVFYAEEYFSNEANAALTAARSQFQSARNSVDLIEEEEATIVEYIDRYQQLNRENVIAPADRLQFLERVTEIRSAHDLFPISLAIDEQRNVRLQYDPGTRDPGGPVNLNVSSVELSLPLLHEADLARLLGDLLSSPGLYQTRDCTISLRNQNANFLTLGQHQEATCNILWYTFDISPPAEQPNF